MKSTGSDSLWIEVDNWENINHELEMKMIEYKVTENQEIIILTNKQIIELNKKKQGNENSLNTEFRTDKQKNSSIQRFYLNIFSSLHYD